MKIYQLLITGFMFLCFVPNLSPGLVWIIGVKNGTLVARETSTNSLYKIDDFDVAYMQGGETEKPLIIQDDLLLSKTLVGDETAYVVYKSGKAIQTTILKWSIIYPVFYKEEAILFMNSPAIGELNSTLKKLDFHSGEIQEIPEIKGNFLHNISGNEILYAQIPEGGRYPNVNIYRQDIENPKAEAELLIENVHGSYVFPSQSGRFIAYNERTPSEDHLKLIDTQTLELVDIDSPEFWESQHQVFIDEVQNKLTILGCRSHTVEEYDLLQLIGKK
ncbi:MAG: hypothetical protein AB8H47_17360 [Bacteroidia bacterium]